MLNLDCRVFKQSKQRSTSPRKLIGLEECAEKRRRIEEEY